MKKIKQMLNSFQHSNSAEMLVHDKVTTDLLLVHYAHEELWSNSRSKMINKEEIYNKNASHWKLLVIYKITSDYEK
jgi:hypothetical protein